MKKSFTLLVVFSALFFAFTSAGCKPKYEKKIITYHVSSIDNKSSAGDKSKYGVYKPSISIEYDIVATIKKNKKRYFYSTGIETYSFESVKIKGKFVGRELYSDSTTYASYNVYAENISKTNIFKDITFPYEGTFSFNLESPDMECILWIDGYLPHLDFYERIVGLYIWSSNTYDKMKKLYEQQ